MPKRDYSIDLLKISAIVGVLTIHISFEGYTYSIGSFNWVSSLFWGSLTRASVPIFLMCSGAVLLNPQKELTLKKLYIKNLLRILIAMIVWAMAYKIYHLLDSGGLSAALLYHSIKEVLLFKQESHLYYLHIIILVYIFLPITRILTCNANKDQLRYFLAVWFVLGIVYPTVKPFWPFTLLGGIPAQWLINMTYSSIGFGVLGYYLKIYSLKNRNIYITLLVAGFAFVFCGTWYMSARLDILYKYFFEGMSVGVTLMAIGLFGYRVSNQECSSPKYSRIVTYLSKASFCVYLVHIFFIYILSKQFGLTVAILPCIFSIPLVVAINLIFSCSVYAVISLIPIVNKWLI